MPAIRTYIENFTSHYGIKVAFSCNLSKRLGIRTETVIYRVIQEALTNIAKYADVSEAEVSIHANEAEIVTRIIDRGAGFDPSGIRKGVGRFNMAERAGLAGGSLLLDSEPNRGTFVTLVISADAAVSGYHKCCLRGFPERHPAAFGKVPFWLLRE